MVGLGDIVTTRVYVGLGVRVGHWVEGVEVSEAVATPSSTCPQPASNNAAPAGTSHSKVSRGLCI